MIELRRVMPNRVTNPTSEPSDIQPPLNQTATTPPMSANGRLRKVIDRLRRLLKAM